MDDLVAFLRARYDEREQRALAASNPNERPEGAVWARKCYHSEEYPPPGGWPCTSCCVVDGDSIRIYDEGGHGVEQALHIADNDPRYVLDDIAAKRQIIEVHPAGRDHPEAAEYCLECGPFWRDGKAHGYPCETIRLLALPFAGHPDYRAEWKP